MDHIADEYCFIIPRLASIPKYVYPVKSPHELTIKTKTIRIALGKTHFFIYPPQNKKFSINYGSNDVSLSIKRDCVEKQALACFLTN
jgi:hypothetical protein